jgi:hypothetical protein
MVKTRDPDPTTNLSPPVNGKATVSGTVGAGSRVVVGNKSQGSASSSLASASGDYSVAIGAAVGDRLVVFAVNLTTKKATGAVEVTVPGP